MPQPNEYRKDWKDKADAHYSARYKDLDSGEISARCNLPFDGRFFSFKLMDKNYRAAFPQFELYEADTESPVVDESIRVLALRYLCDGRLAAFEGGQLSYSDIPWGSLYFKNFEGRCLKRVERIFGKDTQAFSEIFEKHEKLNAKKLSGKECAWRFEFFNGIFISIIIWEGDEDFPSKSQILFDDNFPAAFSAEDTAVACDICINRLKELKDEG
ncbi:MAG: DUF3786 domain-containing protein [Treponema sp.]|jgi:hypothetical protein|nr:DUF3786 domain-containing protein [Treponema sp.]